MRKSFTRLFSILILSMVISLQSFAAGGIAISEPAGGLTNLKSTAKFVVTTAEPVVAGVGVVRLKEGTTTLKTYQASNANVVISSTKNGDDLYEITIDFSTYTAEEKAYKLDFDADFVRAADDAEPSNAAEFDVQIGDYTAPKLVDTNFFDPKTGETKDVQLDNDLKVTFDENVKVAAGAEIYIYTDNGTANGNLYEIVSGAALTVAGKVLTINPGRDFEQLTKYYVTIPEGAIVDEADVFGNDNMNKYAGWLTHDTWYFTTRDNTAPVFSDVMADNIAKDKFDVFFKLDEEGDAYLLAVMKGATAPVEANFIAGNGMKTVAVDDATKSFSVNLTQYFNGTTAAAIAESQAYDIYAYAENTQTPVNKSSIKKILTVKTLDVTAPTIDPDDSWPWDGSTVLAEDTGDDNQDADTLRIDLDDFNGSIESIVKGTGTIEIWKYDAGLNHEKVFSVDVNDASVLVNQTTAKDEIWVPVDYAYESDVTYFVKITSGFAKDDSGNEIVGLLTNDDWTFTIKDFIKPSYTFAVDESALTETSGSFKITLDFNEDIFTAGDVAIDQTNIDSYVTIQVKEGTSWVAVTPDAIAFDGAKDEYVFTINYDNAKAKSEGEYKVIVDADNVYDDADNAGTDGTHTFQLKDYAAPVAALESTSLAPSDNIVIEWDEKVYNADGTAITDSDVENMVIFRKGTDATGSLVSASYSVSADGKSFIINPTNDFTTVGDQYFVKVGAGAVEDEQGNANALFSDVATVSDFVAPTVVFKSNGTEISDGDLVDSDDALVIEFAETVIRKDGASVALNEDAADLLNFNEDGANVPYVASWTTAGKVITVTAASLDPNKTYTVSIGKSLKDAAGNGFENEGIEFKTLSTAAPAVSSTIPKDNATAVAKDAAIKVVFDRDIEINDVSGVTVVEVATNKVATGIAVEGGNTLVIPHADFSASELAVTVTIPANAVYSKGTTIGNVLSTFDFVTFDNVDPVVAASVPDMGTMPTGVAVDVEMSITFDEKVEVGTGTLVIRNKATDLAVQSLTEADLKVDGTNNKKIIITLKEDLAFSTEYYIEVSDGLITDDEGNTYDGITGSSWDFETDEDVAFAVKSTNPADEGDIVGLTDNFVVTFTQPVDASTASATQTILLEVSNKDQGVYTEVFNDAANQSNYTYSGSTLTIDPVDPLVADKDYRLTINNAIVKDTYGRDLQGGPVVVDFYTYDKYAPKYTSTPADADKDVDVNANVVIAWNEEPINPATAAAYTAAEVKDNGIVSISGGIGTSYVVTISGNTWTIDPDATFDDQTTYTVTVKGQDVEDALGNDDNVQTTFDFTTEDNTINNPTATVDNITGVAAKLNVTFDEKGTAYYVVQEKSATAPTAAEIKGADQKIAFTGSATKTVDIKNLTSSVEYTAYVIAVDASSNANESAVVKVNFTTLDIIKPVATIDSPAKGAVGVEADADLVLTFSEEVVATNGAVVIIRDVATDVIQETVTISGTNTTVAKVSDVWTATIERAVTLASNTEYYVEVVAGAFVDKAATPNKTDAINLVDGWSFTIKDTDAPVLAIDGLTPKLAGTPEVAAGTTIMMKFNEAVKAGTGSLIVYYDADDSEFEVVNVADLTFGSDSTVSFNLENTPVEQAEFYVVVPNTIIKDMADNAFAGIAASDWDFVILDQTAPVVASSNPAEGDDDVAIAANLTVTFSENIFKSPDATAFTNTTIDDVVVLKDAAGNVIDVDVTFDGAKVITINPDDDLDSQTEYTITISPVVDSKKNVSEEATITFQTLDNTAPSVTFDPVAKTIAVDANGVVTITFDEPVYDDIATTTEGNKYGVPVLDENIVDLVTYGVSDKDGTGTDNSVDFSGTMSADNMVITITPDEALTSEAWYKVTLKVNSVVDYANNPNAVASTYFQIADGVAPKATAYSPTGGTGATAAMTIQFDEAVQLGTGSIYIRNYEDGTLVEKIDVTVDNVTVTDGPNDDDVLDYVTIAHADFPADMSFYVSADEGAIKDDSENPWEGIATEDINVWAFSTADGVKPELFGADALSPANEETNVGLNAELSVIFDKKIQLNTSKSFYVVIYNEDWTPFQQIEVTAANVNLKALTDPVYQVDRIADISHKEFAPSSKYYVRIEEGSFKDDAGNLFDGLLDLTWSFETEDNDPPTIVWDEVTPLDDATGVNASDDIVITFDRNVVANAAGMIHIYEEVGSEGVLVETIDPTDATKVTIDGMVVTVNPEAILGYNKNFYIIIEEGAFTNTATNKKPFAGVTTTQEWNFSTGGDMDAPMLLTWTPNDETIEANHPTFVMTFNEDVVLGDMGYLVVTEKDSTKATLEIEITEAMIDGNTVTVTYDYNAETGGLNKNTEYYVMVDSATVKDIAGNAFVGVKDMTAWTFTTGADFATDVPDVEVSLGFNVYPNPFDGYVNVDNGDQLDRIVISNVAGQRVKDIVNPTTRIRTGDLRSGIYFITLVKDNAAVKTDRIVKR